MSNTENIKPEYLFDTLGKTSSQAEQEKLWQWMKESEEHQSLYFSAKKIKMLSDAIRYSDVKNVERALEEVSMKIEQSEKRTRMRTTFRIIRNCAALFLLLIGIGSVLHLAQEEQEQYLSHTVSGVDGVEVMVLEDGTKIHLNSHTTIRYPHSFKKEARTVYVEGEAYFEVKKEASRPFIVHSGNMQVKVLGTEFNLKSGRTVETVLVKGAVAINDETGKQVVLLSPGEKALFDTESQHVKVTTVNTDKYTSWRFEQMIFENQSLAAVCRELEKKYGVRVSFQNRIMEQKKIRLVINRNESIEEVMENIKFITPIDYTIKENRVLVTYKK